MLIITKCTLNHFHGKYKMRVVKGYFRATFSAFLFHVFSCFNVLFLVFSCLARFACFVFPLIYFPCFVSVLLISRAGPEFD